MRRLVATSLCQIWLQNAKEAANLSVNANAGGITSLSSGDDEVAMDVSSPEIASPQSGQEDATSGMFQRLRGAPSSPLASEEGSELAASLEDARDITEEEVDELSARLQAIVDWQKQRDLDARLQKMKDAPPGTMWTLVPERNVPADSRSDAARTPETIEENVAARLQAMKDAPRGTMWTLKPF